MQHSDVVMIMIEEIVAKIVAGIGMMNIDKWQWNSNNKKNGFLSTTNFNNNISKGLYLKNAGSLGWRILIGPRHFFDCALTFILCRYGCEL